jgi:membrane protease YdiL (CAAX protease family)
MPEVRTPPTHAPGAPVRSAALEATAPPQATFPPPRAPAGWYADPWFDVGLRYWDGRSWTPHAVVRREAPPHDRLPLRAALGALLALGVPIVLSRFLLRALSDLDWPVAVYVVISGVIGYGPSVAWAVHVSRTWGSGHFRQDVGMQFRIGDLGWGPLTWLGCVFAEISVAAVVLWLNIPFISNTTGVGHLRAERGYVITLLVLAVVVAPIVEEIVFRGVVLRGLLSKWPPAVAITAQALVFGGAHFDPVRGTGNIGLIMVLAAVGGVLGAAAYHFRRIVPTMMAHAILNAVAMAVVLTR